MQKTLLQVGDKVRIRKDINQYDNYHMKTMGVHNCYLPGKMYKPGELVTIASISKAGYRIIEEDFFTYTDEMFDPELIDFLYEEYLEEKKRLHEEYLENNK